jgi:hypothetical protein
MTKERKIVILEIMLSKFKQPVNEGLGFCALYEKTCKEEHFDFTDPYMDQSDLFLLGLVRPAGKKVGDYWYPMYGEGKTIRINILKDLIKKLKAQ